MSVVFKLRAICDRCRTWRDFDWRDFDSHVLVSTGVLEHDLPSGWRYHAEATGRRELLCPNCQDKDK